MLYYGATTSISVIVTSSPFHSPLSRQVYQRVHTYICPSVDNFLSETMDTTPVTTLGRFRRQIQLVLHNRAPTERELS